MLDTILSTLHWLAHLIHSPVVSVDTVCVLLRPSADLMNTTHIMEGNLLYEKSNNLNVNLTQKIPLQKHPEYCLTTYLGTVVQPSWHKINLSQVDTKLISYKESSEKKILSIGNRKNPFFWSLIILFHHAFLPCSRNKWNPSNRHNVIQNKKNLKCMLKFCSNSNSIRDIQSRPEALRFMA